MTKPKTKQKKIKKMTLAELKSWLDGFCSAHDDQWAPSAEQWLMIKTLIVNLEEHTVGAHGHSQPQYQPQTYSAAPPSYNSSPIQPYGGNQPAQAGGFPERAAELQRPSAPKPQMVNTSGGPRLKTPELDTSNGTYESGFG